MSAECIVLVEDDPALRTLTARALRENGYNVRSASSAPEMWIALQDGAADLVLLDNFTPDQMREAVARTKGRARLEASGGLSLDIAAAVASTGVDYLAVGALTHSAPVLDIGADLKEA